MHNTIPLEITENTTKLRQKLIFVFFKKKHQNTQYKTHYIF